MPLTKCPACHKEISTQAASCPNCGHPLAKSAVNTPHNKVSFGRFIVLVLFLIGVMIYWNTTIHAVRIGRNVLTTDNL
jgi:hypothetical protein